MAGPWEDYKTQKAVPVPQPSVNSPAQPEQTPPWQDYQGAKTSALSAGLHGAGNMATFNYLPEIESKFGSGTLDENRAYEQQLKSEHPYAYGTGQVAGAIALPVAAEVAGPAIAGAEALPYVGGAVKAASGLLGSGEITGIGSGMIQGAKTGAVYGALQNPESDPGEKLDTEHSLQNRAMNAVVGGLGGGVLGGVGGRLSQTAATSADQAGEQAFQALKPNKRMATLVGDRSSDVGRTLLDHGIITGNPKSYDQIADEISSHLDTKGKALGDYINTLSDQTKQMATNFGEKLPTDPNNPVPNQMAKFGLDSHKIATAAAKDLDDLSLVPGAGSDVNRIQGVFQDFLGKNPDYIPVDKAQELKEAIGKYINWKRLPGNDVPPQELALRSLYSKMKDGIEDAGEAMSKMQGDDSYEKFLGLKNDYRNLKDAANITNNSQTASTVNRHLSLTDFLAGSAASHAGGMWALPAMYANKFARTYGNQVNAGLLNAQSKATVAAEKLVPGVGAIQSLGRKAAPYGLMGSQVNQRRDTQ